MNVCIPACILIGFDGEAPRKNEFRLAIAQALTPPHVVQFAIRRNDECVCNTSELDPSRTSAWHRSTANGCRILCRMQSYSDEPPKSPARTSSNPLPRHRTTHTHRRRSFHSWHAPSCRSGFTLCVQTPQQTPFKNNPLENDVQHRSALRHTMESFNRIKGTVRFTTSNHLTNTDTNLVTKNKDLSACHESALGENIDRITYRSIQ